MEKARVLVAMKPHEIELVEQEVAAPGPTEVQIRAHRSLVSHGTERAYIMRLPNTDWVKFPCYPGYSSAGVIEAVGKEVTKFKVGDRVASEMSHRSLGNLDQEREIVKLPDNVSFDEATFISLGTVSCQGVRKARIEINESVAIFGLGVVGQLAARLARINGALPVIGVDRIRKRLDLSLKGGADKVVDTSEASWQETLKQMTGGQGPRVIIEATGYPEVIGPALESVAHFGCVVLVGSPRGLSTVNFYRDVHCKQVSIIGAHNGENPKLESRPGYWTRHDEEASVVALLKAKRLDVKPLITERFPADKVLASYRDMLACKGDNMGTVIEWVR